MDGLTRGTDEHRRWAVIWPTPWIRTDDAAELHPRLAGWGDLRDREAVLGITSAMPLVLTPDGEVDPDIDRYIRYSGFVTGLGRKSQEKYLTAVLRLLDLAYGRHGDWRLVTSDDVQDLRAFRINGTSPGGDADAEANRRPVKPQTWNSQEAGLIDFCDWAHKHRLLVHGHPVERRALRARQSQDETPQTVTHGRPDGAEPVKWFTSSAYRRFKQVGFAGYGRDGLRDPRFAGRTGTRDVALADYGWDSGLRIAELSGLLLTELPDVRQDRLYYRGRVTGKGRKGRDYWVGHGGLQRTLDYVETDRAESVERAKARGAYDKVEGLLVVTANGDGTVLVEESKDPDRPAGRTLALSRLDGTVRRRLFTPGLDGFPEPMQMWLTEGGLPISDAGFQAQFRSASLRCEAAYPDDGLKMTPHMLRHSFALHMLLALWRALRLRATAGGGSAEDITRLYGDQWTLVQQMLGHSSQETTRKTYLAPMEGLQIDDLLNDEDLFAGSGNADSLVPRIAKRSRLVLDLPEEATGGETYPEDEPDEDAEDDDLSGPAPTVVAGAAARAGARG